MYNWPLEKKLVHAHHLRALDEAERDAADHESPGTDFDPDQLQQGGMDRMRQQMQRQRSGGGAGRNPLSKYPNVVNVQNPGEDMSWERKDEIMHGPDDPETTIEGDPDETIDVRRPDRIDQAGDSLDE